MTRLRVWVAAAGLAALVGCSKGPPFGDVVGTVVMDGKPIDDGSIRFVPVDGSTSSAGGAIKGGRYSVKVPVTRHRVELSAPKPGTGGLIKKGDGPPVEVIADEWVPDKYGARSELTFDVKAGPNEYNLDLKSK
jgi:hypothetical protein